MRGGLVLAFAIGAVAMLGQASRVSAARVQAGTLVPSIHIGWKVDRISGGNVCVAASGEECRLGESSSKAGGFMYPNDVAVDQRTGDLFVADSANSRVQKLTGTGTFLSMFGWDVNQTKDRKRGAGQAARNICTVASRDECTSGVPGTVAGQLNYPAGLAIAPATGDLYVLEVGVGDYRVDKFSSDGRFVWMVGGGVNQSTGGDLCTENQIQRSHMSCGVGAARPSESLAAGRFKFAQFEGNLLAVGGPEGLLYVGDEHEVQEFEADGKWKRSLVLASLSSAPNSAVAALTIDGRGDLYLVYRVLTPGLPGGERAAVVHEFNARREQVSEVLVKSNRSGAAVTLDGLAVDSTGQLAVIGNENESISLRRFGALYEAGTGRRVAEFRGPSDNDGIAFNAEGDLYIAATDDQEVVGYAPGPIAEPLATSPVGCGVEPTLESAVAFNCALNMLLAPEAEG